MRVCRTDRLYHYLLHGADGLDLLLREGIRPLSARPENERWQAVQRSRPGFFETLYDLFARPVLRVPYHNSGVFLTPIDFRLMPGTRLTHVARLARALTAVPAERAALTYAWEGRRIAVPVSPAALEEAADLWMEEPVRAWFGRDPTMMFFFVPQVAVYPEGGMAVQAEWLEDALAAPDGRRPEA